VRRTAGWVLGAAMLALAAPAAAQFGSPGYQFLQHVKNEEGDDVEKALRDPSSRIIDTQDASTGETALHILARKPNCTWLGYFLNKGADPDIQDKKGETAMYVAVLSGADQCVDYLIIKQADPNLGDRQRMTPLILAVQRRDPALVRKLVAAGANPDLRDLTGNSARDYAKKDSRNIAVAKVLAETPAKAQRQVAGPKLR
jgi:uncharacterized protein